jgi:hypothetical protein
MVAFILAMLALLHAGPGADEAPPPPGAPPAAAPPGAAPGSTALAVLGVDLGQVVVSEIRTSQIQCASARARVCPRCKV